MRSITIAVITAAALAACSTTPDAPPPTGGTPGASGSGPQTSGGGKPPVTGVDLTQGGQKPGASGAGRPSDRSVYYDYDKFDIKDQYKSTVDAHAKFLRANPSTRMMIQGNTDERGSREYNIALGQRRAEGVRRSLLLLGARDDQVEATSLGEEKPKSGGHDESAWSQNRRSDMLYPGEY